MIPRNYQKKANKTSHWLNRKTFTLDHISLIRKNIKLGKPVVLDIGCAEGENTHIFKQAGFDVCGLDFDKKLLNLARKNHSQIKFVYGNVEKLKFKSNIFDCVYCINTLFYTNLNKSVPEILRVIKRNGLAFITFDIKITDLDKDEIVHISSLLTLRNLIKGVGKILYLKKRQRTDKTPFKHRHEYYDVLIKKT